MEKSYRIKANVGKDQFLNVNLKRDVDIYEVLSLKLSQESIYKLQVSNYGVIIGRVLANDAFGVPNAKVSVFIPIKDKDKLRSDIKELYPYGFVNSYNNKNIRFNTLPDYSVAECHKPVGSFPSKRKVLDEDVVIEVYDKYYKYTTITNNAGDYMIFGVPVGEQVIHVDIDLSDIGVLSQRPTDFIYKGYSIDLFESPSEFKQSTNLNELPQIISEDSTVNVYSLWGDKNENEIAITRKDIRIQYKFEPTCVFIGPVITDSSVNSISQNCVPNNKLGEAGQLTAAEGTIEMIRKTIFDTVEEVSIKGNQLIDSNGVWCYQIPMNLDFVCTDEYGNITPTDNPTKGIPTRARVRFRITLNESDNESISSHKARYLVPNNPDLLGDSVIPMVKTECLNPDSQNDNYYEFGTLTNNDCFRDLLWNKVYSVKTYIPRVQKENSVYGEKVTEFVGIKGVNKKPAGGINPLPFNKLNLNFSVPAFSVLTYLWRADDKDEIASFNVKSFWRYLNGNQIPFNIDAAREKILEDMDAIGLDFYNDWLNGCLYFPNWYWYLKTTQDEYSNQKYDSEFCSCDGDSDLCIFNNCSFTYNSNEMQINENDIRGEKCDNMFTKFIYGSSDFKGGIIKKIINKDGFAVYYYSFGQERKRIERNGGYSPFVRLFSTDIILLGSLDDCDIHGVPKVSTNLPSTTSDIPPIGRLKAEVDKDEGYELITNDMYNLNRSTVNGMSWGEYWYRDGNLQEPIRDRYNGVYSTKLSSGLFFGLSIKEYKKSSGWLPVIGAIFAPIGSLFHIRSLISLFSGDEYHYLIPFTNVKSCVNAERICELGVVNDSDAYVKSGSRENEDEKNLISKMDGLITRREILDSDTRALFATLNSTKLICEIETDATGYKTYNLDYLYPTNFDGRMEKIAPDYTRETEGVDGPTHDVRSKDYLDFRFGSISNDVSYVTEQIYGNSLSHSGTRNFSGRRYQPREIIVNVSNNRRHFYGEYSEEINNENAFPVYNNSFYFYFGINAAHNAISEFYKNFLLRCSDSKKISFSVSLTISPSSYCSANKGIINYDIKGATPPFNLYLFDNSNEDVAGEKYKKIYNATGSINGLENGRYSLKVEDVFGKSVIEEVFLKKEKVKLDFSVVSSIQIKYIEGEEDAICENKQYGIIRINSIEYNGSNTVNQLPNAEWYENDKKLVFSLNDYKLTIITISGDKNMKKYYCGSNGNEIYFKKPGNFIIRVEENSCSQNYSDYDFSISDSDEFDLYINTMPLKFFAGLKENNVNTYAKHFYTKKYDTSSTVYDVRGWLGVHNPKMYDESFYGDATTDVNERIWDYEKNKYASGDILTVKFKKLFNVASNSYITNGTKNVFDAKVSGNRVLLRASYPQYDKFNEKEGIHTFTSYITCNKGLTKECPQNTANIVADNFRFINRDGMPLFDEDPVNYYYFNPKYDYPGTAAGNYFASFSNNANYINNCVHANLDKKPIIKPYGADDLSSYNLCIGADDKIEKMLHSVYDEYTYFRTEFVDRRLDYDLIYVTPCTTEDKASSDRVWANGRLSGLTYNGIEMAYKDTYRITSKETDTEYIYDEDKMSLELNTSDDAKKKRLFSSEFSYGGTSNLDLRTLYYSKNRKNVSIVSSDDINVHNHSTDATLNDKCFDNFGLSDDKETILGYPTKRMIDIYNIPYGSGIYKWSGQSCLYNTSFDKYDSISTKGGEIVSCSIDFNNQLNVIVNDAVYKNAGGYSFSINEFVHKSTVSAPDVPGLASKLMGAKLIMDTGLHEGMNLMKTRIDKNLTEVFNNDLGDNLLVFSDKISIDKTGIESNVKFIGIALYHMFENCSFDNLLKRIRLFNLSNYYNVGNITFAPDNSGGSWLTIGKKDNVVVDRDTVNVKSYVEGYVESTGDITIEGQTIHVRTRGEIENGVAEGKPENDPEGVTSTEYMHFLLTTDAFSYDDIELDYVSISVELGEKAKYTPIIEKKGESVSFSIALSGNSILLTEYVGNANIIVNIPVKNKVNYILKFAINNSGIISNIS